MTCGGRAGEERDELATWCAQVVAPLPPLHLSQSFSAFYLLHSYLHLFATEEVVEAPKNPVVGEGVPLDLGYVGEDLDLLHRHDFAHDLPELREEGVWIYLMLLEPVRPNLLRGAIAAETSINTGIDLVDDLRHAPGGLEGGSRDCGEVIIREDSIER